MKGLFVGAAILTIAGAAAAQAQSADVEAFYKGKTVNIVISTGPGGTYDTTSRTIMRHMQKYIPGQPTMIVKYMPGGGHLLATNYMYNQAPKDGTYMATVANHIPLHQVLDGNGVRYDASKFTWLGSTGSSNMVTFVWHTTGIKTFDELRQRQVITGATGAGSGTVLYPTVMNNVLGTKFKIVSGYQNGVEVDLAMERGEVEARSGVTYTGMVNIQPKWIKDGTIVFLAQVGETREPELPDVPLLTDLAKTEEQKTVLKLISSPIVLGRAYFSTPDVPAARLEALRQAFDKTIHDADFVAEVKKLNLDLSPLSAAVVTRMVNETINVSPAMLEKAKIAMEGAGGVGP